MAIRWQLDSTPGECHSAKRRSESSHSLALGPSHLAHSACAMGSEPAPLMGMEPEVVHGTRFRSRKGRGLGPRSDDRTTRSPMRPSVASTAIVGLAPRETIAASRETLRSPAGERSPAAPVHEAYIMRDGDR